MRKGLVTIWGMLLVGLSLATPLDDILGDNKKGLLQEKVVNRSDGSEIGRYRDGVECVGGSWNDLIENCLNSGLFIGRLPKSQPLALPNYGNRLGELPPMDINRGNVYLSARIVLSAEDASSLPDALKTKFASYISSGGASQLFFTKINVVISDEEIKKNRNLLSSVCEAFSSLVIQNGRSPSSILSVWTVPKVEGTILFFNFTQQTAGNEQNTYGFIGGKSSKSPPYRGAYGGHQFSYYARTLGSSPLLGAKKQTCPRPNGDDNSLIQPLPVRGNPAEEPGNPIELPQPDPVR